MRGETYTIRFGCERETNNIPIKEGNNIGKFKVLMRHYNTNETVINNEEGYNPILSIKKFD